MRMEVRYRSAVVEYVVAHLLKTGDYDSSEDNSLLVTSTLQRFMQEATAILYWWHLDLLNVRWVRLAPGRS